MSMCSKRVFAGLLIQSALRPLRSLRLCGKRIERKVDLSDYRVQLDVFTGPLDLLLFLIRRDEVDILDIPIVRITEQYLEHLQALQQLDPDAAGDFLVMAATLIELKSRMLLPAAPLEVLDEGDDPR